MSALNKFATTVPTQREKARPDQVKNNAGGYVFKADDVARLERFLILGTDGGTYYVGERDLTKANVDFIRKMIATDPKTVLSTTVAVSSEGRAYRNEAAIFVMALMLSEPEKVPGVKTEVVAAIPSVARIATHVYQLAAFIEGLGGWGRAKRRAIAEWFQSKTADQLAYQAVKYRQRNGWAMRDLMRLSHPTGIDRNVGNFILGKEYFTEEDTTLRGFKMMQSVTTANGVIRTLQAYPNLPWETIPTQFLKDADVWKNLFYNGQLKGQALVRQITRLSRIGAFDDMVFARDVATKLEDSDMIAKTRLHPIQYLLASVTHTEGQMKRDPRATGWWITSQRVKDWNTVPVILDALTEGYHLAFKALEPAGKRTMVSVDTSGSMGMDAVGIDLSAAQAAAAMAMTIARSEPYYHLNAFSTEIKSLAITPKMDLAQAMRVINSSWGGGTDCSQPMLFAAKAGIEVDTFVILTDNETWAGRVQPYEALKQYRNKMGIDAKLAVVGISSTEFTIADPRDSGGMMDFVGFDTNTPKVLADFSAGRL